MLLYVGSIHEILENFGFLAEGDSALLEYVHPLKGKRRESSLAGRCLLKKALLEKGLLQPGEPLPEMQYNSLGKPSFKALDWFFSISHSDDLVAVALSQSSLGLDLEVCRRNRKYSEQLIRSSQCPLEGEFSKDMEGDTLISFFLQQWTLREALLKEAGRSIFEMRYLEIDPFTLQVKSALKSDGYVCIMALQGLEFLSIDRPAFLALFTKKEDVSVTFVQGKRLQYQKMSEKRVTRYCVLPS